MGEPRPPKDEVHSLYLRTVGIVGASQIALRVMRRLRLYCAQILLYALVVTEDQARESTEPSLSISKPWQGSARWFPATHLNSMRLARCGTRRTSSSCRTDTHQQFARRYSSFVFSGAPWTVLCARCLTSLIGPGNSETFLGGNRVDQEFPSVFVEDEGIAKLVDGFVGGSAF